VFHQAVEVALGVGGPGLPDQRLGIALTHGVIMSPRRSPEADGRGARPVDRAPRFSGLFIWFGRLPSG
jgi:hypothetical protein